MNKIHFEKLTPTKDIDLSTYKQALDFVFTSDEIKNIAITGSYSAGKSSVIEAYKSENKDKQFLHISLANFESNDNEDSCEDEGSNKDIKYKKESILEGKILNQLLHQIDTSKIPQTNFKVKRTDSNRNTIKVTAMMIIFLLASIHILYYQKWCNFVDSLRQFYNLRFLLITTNSISLLFSGIIIVTIFSIVLHSFIRIQKNKGIFKRFNLNGNEIEIFERTDESYFDKYLNEVLYIFENADADVIVFEDIDRYNINEIFQRLREINTLINAKRIIQNNKVKNEESKNYKFEIFNNFNRKLNNLRKTKNIKKPLRFFYLVRDDIFISKDRTKFFDFIMPVVPVIDGSNSYDQFISHFKVANIFNKFDEHFLQGISLYVDDMRILKNIYNEFIVYYNRIGTTEQDYNKLLAMIVYKNIFPRDFSDTQVNVGFISTIFGSKEELIKDEIDKINIKIQQLKEIINKCEQEHLKSVEELNKVYSNYSYRPPHLDSDNPEYIERKNNIELIKNNKLNEVRDEINRLEQEKIKLNNEKLSKIITRENKDKAFDVKYKNFLNETNDFNEIKSSQYFDLIKYLIWNGYIDETYVDYITYFYPNSLSRNDKVFLRSVTDKKAKEWSYKIENPQLVVSMLKVVDFDEVETLNFDLFSWLLQKQNKKYLSRFIKRLKNNKQFDFMARYFNYTDDITSYIRAINKYWPSFLEEMSSCSEFKYSQIKEYILETLYNSSEDKINKINNNGILSKIISEDDLFLNIVNPNIQILIDKFKLLNIKFKNLNFKESNEDLFKDVYKNKMYEFNFENISSVLRNIFKNENEDDISNKNYTLIFENSNSELFEYVSENINTYLGMVINNCDGKIFDTQDAALNLINDENINELHKREYILRLDTVIENLENVDYGSMCDLLLQNEKVKYSIENILHYYFEISEEIDETLVSFINSNISKFEFTDEYIDNIYGENSAGKIFNSIALCEGIKELNYRNLLEQLKFKFSSPPQELKDFSKEKIAILVELNRFNITSDNIEFLRMNYNGLMLEFIKNNIEEYLEKINDLPKLNEAELTALLYFDIEDDLKIELISNHDYSILISGRNYSDKLKDYIMKNNFDDSELTYIISNYEDFSDLIKENINRLCEENIKAIVSDEIELNNTLLMSLLSKEIISKEVRLQLLVNNMNNLSKEQIEEAIKVIKLNEHAKIFTSGRPKIEINEINRQFLSKCKQKGWISDFSEKEEIFKIERRNLRRKFSSEL